MLIRVLLTATVAAAIATPAQAALRSPDFMVYLGGEGVAEAPAVHCASGASGAKGGVSCMPMALRPVGSCRVDGRPGKRWREVVLPARGRARVVRRCYVTRDGGGAPTLMVNQRWASGGVACRAVARGRGLAAETELACRNR